MIANLMPEDLFFVWQAVKSCPPPFRALPLSQRNIDENLFVSLSSPSSSRYDSVADLGSPETAAARILDQYLTQEFMSTRIGIRREGKVGERGEGNLRVLEGGLCEEGGHMWNTPPARDPCA